MNEPLDLETSPSPELKIKHVTVIFAISWGIITFFATACQESENPVAAGELATAEEYVPAVEAPFKLGLGIGYDDGPWLNADLELADGSWVASPHSEDDFYMPLTLSIEESKGINLAGAIKERPRSIKEFDSIIGKEVSLVRGNTIFSQKLEVTATGVFEARGKIEFLLEPACVPYTVDFVISDDYEMVTVTKMGTTAAITKN